MIKVLVQILFIYPMSHYPIPLIFGFALCEQYYSMNSLYQSSNIKRLQRIVP